MAGNFAFFLNLLNSNLVSVFHKKKSLRLSPRSPCLRVASFRYEIPVWQGIQERGTPILLRNPSCHWCPSYASVE